MSNGWRRSIRKNRGAVNPHEDVDWIIVTEYSYSVTKRAKLLAKARANPGSLSFSEFEALLMHCGFVFKRQTGSHRIWLSPTRRVMPL